MTIKSFNILFVCTGNICRSPTAEAVFRQKIGEGFAGIIDSAGLQGYHIGDPPDPRSIAMARERGVEMSGLRARKVRAADFADFDYIIAMDQGHLRALEALKPKGSSARVSLLLDDHPVHRGRDVPDPYYGGRADFEEAYDLIEAGIEVLIADLLR